jgi:hypothetical protein
MILYFFIHLYVIYTLLYIKFQYLHTMLALVVSLVPGREGDRERER